MNTDESAFPTGGASTHRDGSLMHVDFRGGMTLRDYFAAKAMGVMFSTINQTGSDELIAKRAYDIADAMLKARQS